MRFSASSRIHLAVVAHVLGQARRALPPMRLRRALALTSFRVHRRPSPENRGGISIIALLMSTATGFRSLA